MLSILDRYILKRYLGTFVLMLLLFIPIGITVNLAEKIDKILDNQVPFWDVALYYIDFTVYFANLLFPLFLFLSIIWFTSKLANNTEIIAFLSSGVSFSRFLRPYLIGAFIVSIASVVLGMYLAPEASKGFNEFKYAHLKSRGKDRSHTNVYSQLNANDFVYVSYFNPKNNAGNNFSFEHFEDNELKYKIYASRIIYNKDSTYTLYNFEKRTIGEFTDRIESRSKLDTILNFTIDELTPADYVAETLNYVELNNFIEKEKLRGSEHINRYKLVKHKRWSVPASAFILTIIAVSVSSVKRRGGMGINLVIGITIGMIYIFFDKIFGTMAEKSGFSPFIAAWFPNFVFGLLAIYLLQNAKR